MVEVMLKNDTTVSGGEIEIDEMGILIVKDNIDTNHTVLIPMENVLLIHHYELGCLQ